MTGFPDGQPETEDDQEESREVITDTEVTKMIEDPVVEGLQEMLESSGKQECSTGGVYEQELCGRERHSELLEGRVEQLWI